jgi:adenylylsulfate kinase
MTKGQFYLIIVREKLENPEFRNEAVDGDRYRKTVCNIPGYSRADRCENLRRAGRLGIEFARNSIIVILALLRSFK